MKNFAKYCELLLKFWPIFDQLLSIFMALMKVGKNQSAFGEFYKLFGQYLA
jgi:hypothetical protein